MTTNTPIDEQAIIPVQVERQLTYDELPPLLPQQLKMLSYIIDGDNYTEAYRKAGYESVEHAGKAAFVLISRNPLKAHLEYFRREIAREVTPQWKISILRKIAESSTGQEKEIAIKAIAELNKMQGDYAAQSVNVNTVTASIDDVRNAMTSYKKEC